MATVISLFSHGLIFFFVFFFFFLATLAIKSHLLHIAVGISKKSPFSNRLARRFILTHGSADVARQDDGGNQPPTGTKVIFNVLLLSEDTQSFHES